MKDIYTLDEVRAALADRVVSIVAEKTGIHVETLYSFIKKRRKGLNFRTYEILVNYLFGNK